MFLGSFGGGGAFFFPTNFFFQKSSWGSESHTQNTFFWGGGGRAGLENDTLLPMTSDRPKFWNSPAWRSKVIIRKPWRRKNKKQENHKNKKILTKT